MLLSWEKGFLQALKKWFSMSGIGCHGKGCVNVSVNFKLCLKLLCIGLPACLCCAKVLHAQALATYVYNIDVLKGQGHSVTHAAAPHGAVLILGSSFPYLHTQ